MPNTNILNLEGKTIEFIKGNAIAQELLKHLHPSAETAILVKYDFEAYPSSNSKIAIMFGARRVGLFQSHKAKEVEDVINKLKELGVLEGTIHESDIKCGVYTQAYYALNGEWSGDGPTIYSQLCPNRELREQLHKAIGSELPERYYVDK